jgi:hypothetical protein
MDRRQIIQDLTVYMNDVVARHVPKSGIIFMVDSGHDISVLVGSEYLCSYSLEYMIWAVDFSREESVLEYVYDLTATKQADMSDTIVAISHLQ